MGGGEDVVGYATVKAVVKLFLVPLGEGVAVEVSSVKDSHGVPDVRV
jgi:hypothetical protein